MSIQQALSNKRLIALVFLSVIIMSLIGLASCVTGAPDPIARSTPTATNWVPTSIPTAVPTTISTPATRQPSASATPGRPTIEFSFVPPYGSSERLRGLVRNVPRPADYRVAVYIYVNGWWTKPTWDSPLTSIQSDGSWTAEIVTGGNDQLATKITAYLVPAGYKPPLAKGDSDLPSDLEAHQIAKIQVTR